MPAKDAPVQERFRYLDYEEEWIRTLTDVVQENGGSVLITDRMGVEVRPFDYAGGAAEYVLEDQFPLKIFFAHSPICASPAEDTSPSTGKVSGDQEVNSNCDKNLPILGAQTSGEISYNDVWPGILVTKLHAVGATECLERTQCVGSTFMVTDACGVEVDLGDEYMPDVTRFPLKLHFKGTHHKTRQNLEETNNSDIGQNSSSKAYTALANVAGAGQEYTVQVCYKSLLADVVNCKMQDMSIPTDTENRPMVLITDHTGVQVCEGVPDRSKFPLKYYIENSSMDKSTLQDIKKAWWNKLHRMTSKDSPRHSSSIMRTLVRLGSGSLSMHG